MYFFLEVQIASKKTATQIGCVVFEELDPSLCLKLSVPFGSYLAKPKKMKIYRQNECLQKAIKSRFLLDGFLLGGSNRLQEDSEQIGRVIFEKLDPSLQFNRAVRPLRLIFGETEKCKFIGKIGRRAKEAVVVENQHGAGTPGVDLID